MNHPSRESQLAYIELSLISYKNYIILIEDSLQKIIETSKNWAGRALKEIDQNKQKHGIEYHAHLSDSVIGQHFEIEIEFKHRFYCSLIIQLYSFLEIELKYLCGKHAKKNNIVCVIKDLENLDKIKKYLKTVGVNLSKLPEWSFINNFRILRNKIVHGQTMIEQTNKDYHGMKNFSVNNFSFKPADRWGVPEHEKVYEFILDNKDFIHLSINQIESFLVGLEKV